jgi:hypothetical protein
MRINPKQVHASLVLDEVEGRPDGAWVIRYRGEAFLVDTGGGNPEPFVSNGQRLQPIESRAHARAPEAGFDARTADEIAGELRINPALLSFVERSDASFPAPIATFRDGPVWSAEAVERWLPTRESLPARDRGQQRG